MKRPLEEDPTAVTAIDKKMKKIAEEENGFVHLDEDLLFEVLKYCDARTLASASCVSKQWKQTADDERLWEMICMRHWASKSGSCTKQRRSVVSAMGGFRRLYALCIWPLLKPAASTSSASTSSAPMGLVPARAMPTHWGKDEVNLSLSLLSIQYFARMTPIPRKM